MRLVYAAALAVFVLAAASTLSSARMMGGAMRMPGGWTMAMAWMRMPGQTWLSAGAMFAAMWLAMMVTMMLPSSLPMLLLYRRVARFRGEAHADTLIWLMAGGYFFIWTMFGVVAYVLGVTLAGAAMRWPQVSYMIPAGAGLALIAAGAYQLTPWKAACLQHCRDPLEVVASHLRPGWRGALSLGLHHGLFCTGCCWALMVMQLVMGVMSLGAMAAIAVVIALEKFVERGALVARLVGVVSIGAGAVMLARAVSAQ